MHIERFYDKGLAHASYAVLSNGEIALVDPARDPQPYLEFAEKNNARISTIIETHPHADFVSGHYEIHQRTGATIYASSMVAADYPHEGFDQDDEIELGNVKLIAYNTPGHSPDSISVIVQDENGKKQAIFTGDTLFIGDVGRPDLREKAGNMTAKREEMARQMYQSTRNVFMELEKDIAVYPAHGAGSLCGRNMSDKLDSTIGEQLTENAALQEMDEEAFVDYLLEGQPFIPKYFGHDVNMNKQGAPSFEESVAKVPRLEEGASLQKGITVVDTRPQEQFKQGHNPGAINIMDGEKFETWLGSLLAPDEEYYLVAATKEVLESVIRKTAKIGYEGGIKGAVVNPAGMNETSDKLDLKDFRAHPEKYNIIDIRNASEVEVRKIFDQATNIPLPELREKANEINDDKPVVIHCAGGYRSAAGASIVENASNQKVYDLSEEVNNF